MEVDNEKIELVKKMNTSFSTSLLWKDLVMESIKMNDIQIDISDLI